MQQITTVRREKRCASWRTDKMTRKFIKSSPPKRKKMYKKLIETLRQNSDRPYQEDYDLLQEMNDNER